jgi:hypothetical protein
VFVSVTRYDRYESESPDASGSLAHAEPGLPTGIKARLSLEFEGVRIAAPSLPTVIARPSPATASAAAQARAASNPGRGAQCAGLSLRAQPERGMQRHVERAPTPDPSGRSHGGVTQAGTVTARAGSVTVTRKDDACPPAMIRRMARS